MADVFTTAGAGLVVDILDTTVAVPTWYIGWGTGVGTAAIGDTTLFTEASETRVAATLSQPAASTSRYVATLTADAGKTITNAGVFSAVSSGTLLQKSDFTGIVLALGDKIELTFDLAWS
jgi:hypothetical protein